MSARQQKQRTRLALRDATADAVRALAYFPADWVLHLELCNRADIQCAVRRDRKHPHVKRRHLFLRLEETWLDTVHANGWSVIDGWFVLTAHRLLPEVVPGMDDLLWLDCVTVEGPVGGHMQLLSWTGFAAHYAGQWSLAESPEGAAHEALREWHHLWTGEPFVDMPF